MIRYLLLNAFLLFFSAAATSQDNSIDRESALINIIERAESLYAENNYSSAMEEYRRYFSLAGENRPTLERVIILTSAGCCCINLKQYKEATKYLEAADSIHRNFSILVDEYRCLIEDRLALAYYMMNEYDKALQYGKLNLNHSRRFYKSESKQTAEAYNSLSLICQAKGELAQAANYLQKYISTNISVNIFNEKNIRDIKALIRLGKLYNQLNKCDEGIACLAMADSLLSNIDKYHPLRLDVNNQLFTISVSIGDLQDAEMYITEAIGLSKNMNLDSEALMSLYNNVVVFYMQEEPDIALSLIKEIIQDCQKNGKNKSINYALIITNYAFMLGVESDEFLLLMKEAIEILEDLKSVDITILIGAYCQYIEGLLAQKTINNDLIVDKVDLLLKVLAKRLNDSFLFLSESERTMYWSQVRGWYQEILPYLAMHVNTSEIHKLCFDGLLQSRGILLCSTVSIENHVYSSDNSMLKGLYAQLSSAKNHEVDVNEDVVRNIEKRILQGLSEYCNFMEVINVNTDSVKKHLKDGDVAIEFMKVDMSDSGKLFLRQEATVPSDNESNVRYFALVLKSKYETPHMVELCMGNQLYSEHSSDLFYKQVWKPLEEELKDVQRIFFSPDGRLFSLPIEYSILPSGECMMDRYQCCRLSSTRELVRKNMISGKDVVLYGGICYDMSLDEMVRDAEKYRIVSAENVKERGNRDALCGISELPGTLVETTQIADVINSGKNQAIKVHSYTGKDATEASFKALARQKKRIVHIATHGFFETDMRDSIYVTDFDDNSLFAEEIALSRSGLLFAGVDNVRFQEPIPDGVEDGVMDANEISHIDLYGTDMVVLSACQTAQGVVTGDGVFGLQRGFKKAGVNSILMSLWKVDDEATCLLMTEFYKNWIGQGKTKCESLELAKQTVRSHKEKGWNAPKYWAAFILLDGLD